MNDLVSIIIPVYNLGSAVIHSLESVIKQTYKNVELILVDDGSTDDSVLIARRYLSDNKKEYKIIMQKNAGPSSARNTGIQVSNGKWVLCLDGDDYLVPEAIERMVIEIQEHDVKCVFCAYKSVDDISLKNNISYNDGCLLYSSEQMRKLFFNRKLVPIVPGMLMERSICEKVQYDEKCRYCEDTLFLWELFYYLDKFAFLHSDMYNYYQRMGSTMHSLKPEKYLSSSPRHKHSAEVIQKRFPNDKIARMIYPKFRLGGLRIISRNNTYEDFLTTVKKDGGNVYIKSLTKQTDVRLLLYALIFIVSKKLFYNISKWL